MMKKLDTIECGLNEIELIDKKISNLLDDDNYKDVIDILKNRLVVISQITSLREKFGGIPDKLKSRFEQVFTNAELIQAKIKDKQGKLKVRLDKHKKTTVSNRGRTYKSR